VVRGVWSKRQDRPPQDTDVGGSVQMNIASQPKKSSSHKSRSKRRGQNVSKLLEQNMWNPFERVDPKVLEQIHKKHETTARKFMLDNTEDALL
jgi:hypothetical protein